MTKEHSLLVGLCFSCQKGTSMPLYYFSTTHGQVTNDHLEGLELPDDEAAWREATTSCGEMIRDLDGDLKAGPEWRMEVKRESGEVVYRLRFSAEAYEK
jgi:uncharacterized protein DUF6894